MTKRFDSSCIFYFIHELLHKVFPSRKYNYILVLKSKKITLHIPLISLFFFFFKLILLTPSEHGVSSVVSEAMCLEAGSCFWAWQPDTLVPGGRRTFIRSDRESGKQNTIRALHLKYRTRVARLYHFCSVKKLCLPGFELFVCFKSIKIEAILINADP